MISESTSQNEVIQQKTRADALSGSDTKEKKLNIIRIDLENKTRKERIV